MRVGCSFKKMEKKESPLQQIFRNGIQLAKTLVLMVLLDFLKDLCGCRLSQREGRSCTALSRSRTRVLLPRTFFLAFGQV